MRNVHTCVIKQTNKQTNKQTTTKPSLGLILFHFVSTENYDHFIGPRRFHTEFW